MSLSEERPCFDVVVVGAGLTGLTAAYRLSKQGVSVALVEQKHQVGGVIDSERCEGYLIEHGPHTFQWNSEALIQLCEDLELPIIPTASRAKKRYLYHQGHLRPVPLDPLGMVATPLLSWQGKIRLLAEPFQSRPAKQPTSEESVSQFISRRLGLEALTTLVAPFLSGVYGGDSASLSAEAVFPKLIAFEREAGSLLQGFLRQSRLPRLRPNVSHSAGTLLGFADGIAQLPLALAQALPAGVLQLKRSLSALTFEAGCFQLSFPDGLQWTARSVVVATNAHQAGRLLGSLVPSAGTLLEDIDYVPMAVVHLGFRREDISHPLDGFGCLIPREENIISLGCIWTSQLFPNRAPADHVLLSTFMGGAFHRDTAQWDDAQLVQQALDDLGQLFHVSRPLNSTFHKVIRWQEAIPQYNVGHLERIKSLQEALTPWPGLILVGNYLNGVSLNDCVRQANQAVKTLQERACLKISS